MREALGEEIRSQSSMATVGSQGVIAAGFSLTPRPPATFLPLACGLSIPTLRRSFDRDGVMRDASAGLKGRSPGYSMIVGSRTMGSDCSAPLATGVRRRNPMRKTVIAKALVLVTFGLYLAVQASSSRSS